MRIQSKLCHIDSSRVVVQVKLWDNDTLLGSALGEGITAEIAEDRALDRAMQVIKRELKPKTPESSVKQKVEGNNYKSDATITPAKRIDKRDIKIKNDTSKYISKDISNDEPNISADPEDWSSELASIDIEIQRLGWNRSQEDMYIQKTFGHKSRNRITKYDEMKSLLTQLKSIDNKSQTNSDLNLERNKLIRNSDLAIERLGWKSIIAQEFLIENLNVSSRNNLNNEQLIAFTELLLKQIE